MTEDGASLDPAVKAEWDTLRSEIATRDAQSFQIMAGSVTGTTALLAFFITLVEKTGTKVPNATAEVYLPWGLYFLPFAIMLPSLYLVVNNAHSSSRIAGYIQHNLESRSALGWEGALTGFYDKLSAYRKNLAPFWRRWGVAPFEEVKVMFVLFVALGLLDAGVFFYRGEWGSVDGWKPWLLAVPFLIFIDAGVRVFGKWCARKHYSNMWAAERADEQLLDDRP